MYKVDISCKEGSVFDVTSGEAKSTIDMAEKENLGPLPTLLAALGSCMGVFLRRYADNMKLPIKEFSISVAAEIEKTPVMCFKKIDVSIDLKGAPLDQAKKDGIMRFINNCPVHNTLHGNPEINAELK